ncbi:MAG: von Willebrand factor type A domain-containing protein [Bryobacteraceae bacterium]
MKPRPIVALFVCLLAGLLAAQSAGLVIQGVVLDPSGAPAAEVTVELAAGSVTVQQTKTDVKGRFRFAGLRKGWYLVRVRQVGGGLASKTAEAGAAAVELRLPPAGVAGSIPGGAASGVIGGIIGGVPAAPPPPPMLAERAMNTEEYSHPGEHGFASVARRPLSTFSADVDTASYSNIRRFLREGRLPPKEAVRIEEMLNYFRYSYPDPPPNQPVSITAGMAECPWNREHALVRIGIKTRAIAADRLPPANLVFLIDVSGSMYDPLKLPLLKKSFALLIDRLRSQDRVSIVVYAGAAGTVLPSTPGSQKEKIRAALESLQAGGSTAGGAGIQLAYATARENFIRGGNNRVILATDGDFNVGVSSDDELVKLIRGERDRGIFLTVLGYGYGNLKDSKLEKLADHGNGHYAYVDSLLEARKVLVQEMGATMLTVAKDVKLQVEFNPAHVRAWRLIGYDNRRLKDEDFKNDKKDAGDLGAGHSVTALYEVVPVGAKTKIADDPLKYQQVTTRPDAAGSAEALTVKVRYKDPAASVSKEIAMTTAYAKPPMREAPADFRFAAGLAEFGLLLAGSEYKGTANYASAIGLLESAPTDENGWRSEAIFLAKTARTLAVR